MPTNLPFGLQETDEDEARTPAPSPRFDTSKIPGAQLLESEKLPFAIQDDEPAEPRKPVGFLPGVADEIPYEDLPAPAQALVDTTDGFNKLLAEALGTAINVNPVSQGPKLVNQALELLGQEGFLDNPGDGVQALKSAFEKLGLTTGEEIDNTANDVGRALFQNMLIAATIFASAPSMAVMQGEGLMANLLRNLGQETIRRPGVVAGAELGATVGGEILDTYGPLGEIAGNILGGAVGGGAVAGARDLPRKALDVGKAALKGSTLGGAGGALFGDAGMAAFGAGTGGAVRSIPALWRALRRSLPEVDPQPTLRGSPGGAEDAMNFAREAVAGDKARVDNTIIATINKVRGDPVTGRRGEPVSRGDPLKSAERMRFGLKRAFRAARQDERKLWRKVNSKQPVDVTGLKQFANRMVSANAKLAPENLPGDMINRIRSISKTKYVRGPDGKRQRVQTPETTIRELLALRGVINAQLREPITNDTLRKNLTMLQDRILDEIGKAYPNNPDIQAARDYSRWLHDRFTRGPIGDFINRRQGADNVTDPGQAIEQMIRREKAGADIADVAQRLDRPSLETQAASYIRNRFRDLASEMDAAGAQAGTKWLRKPEVQRFMRNFPKVDAEMDIAQRNLTEQLAEVRNIEQSALTKFAGVEGPQAAIKRVFTNPKKIGDVRQIVARLSEDENAINGFRSGIVSELFRAGGTSPSRSLALMGDKDIRNAMREVFTTSQFARLERIMQRAAQLETTGESTVRQGLQRGTNILGRVVGAQLGRQVAHVTGGGTVQTPGIFSSATAESLDRMFAQYMPANELMIRAVVDPRWERVLYSRVPETLDELGALTKQLRGLTSSLTAAGQLTEGALTDE